MKPWHQKPHLTLWLSIPLILGIGLLAGDTTLDINIHDTYIVISTLLFCVFLATVFALLGLGYWLVYRFGGKLVPWMTLAHITLTFGALLSMLILDQLYEDPISAYAYNRRLYQGMVIAFGAALAGQGLYMINLIRGFTRKRRNP